MVIRPRSSSIPRKRPLAVRVCAFAPVAAFLCLCFLLGMPRALAADAPPGYMPPPATVPVPPGATVTLEVDRTEYSIGENVLVHFVLANTGTQPFEASWGGDSRGTMRPLRFKVTATDEAGRTAEDPYPVQNCFGGFLQIVTLQPGETFVTSLALMRYCDIDRPGVYTIRAAHDLGWKEGARKHPVGETTVTFRMPDAAEAERIVSDMEKLPADVSPGTNSRTPPYADFTCLRHPVYLEPLLRRALEGHPYALDGIAGMGTAEATEALIRLAREGDAKVALGAAKLVNARLPRETRPGLPPPAPGWDARFQPDVRSLAVDLLARKDAPEVVASGADLLEGIGTPEDAPALFAALDRALEATAGRPRRDPGDNVLDFPQPVRELVRALDALHARGYSLGESVSGNGQILLYFEWLAKEPPPRPARWPQMLDAFGKSGAYPIREAALRSIPQPMPAEHERFVLEMLEDEDLGVCRAACAVAGASGNRAFLKPLLDLVATEHHVWLLQEADAAARKLGAGYDLLEVWADRLNELHLYPVALDALQTVLEVPSGANSGRTDLSRAERLELRKAWKQFLAQHADEIRNGKRFNPRDPAVTPALAGRARSWKLPDGSVWP